MLLSDGWDIWKAPVHGGAGVNLTGNGKKDQIRYQTRFRLDAEEKGIDLSAPIYFAALGERTKKGGIGVVQPGASGIQMLHWDDAHYQNVIKAKHADVYLYTRETPLDFPNYLLVECEAGRRAEDHGRESAAEGFSVDEGRCG